MKATISPSILSADFSKLGEEVKITEEAGAKYLHIDVMDGMFVPSISFGMPVIKSIRKESGMVFDVHLMIEKPERYIEEFAKAGADIITFHEEATDCVKENIEKIHSLGLKAGLSIKPNTPVSALEPFMDSLDLILIMSVEPGFGGQKYIETSTDKIRQTRELIDKSGREIELSVDGGIKLDNVDMVVDAGVNVFVAGSSVYNGDIAGNIKAFNAKLA